VKELGEGAVAICGDLTQECEASRLLEETHQHFGGCDLLVNNMAMTSTDRFHERSTESIKFEVNVIMIATMILSRLAVPYLQRSQDPRIITMTSLGGITPLREIPIYCAAKFGLRGAMLAFALDEKAHGIKVSCILPTATDTYMLRQEALEGGSVLNFIDDPQPISAVVKQVMRQLESPKLERYPKKSDSYIARFGMLFPNLQRILVPLFEKKGRRGHARYRRSLHERGLIEEVDGKLRQKARPHLR
jgi:short-subunit dehydrogenase